MQSDVRPVAIPASSGALVSTDVALAGVTICESAGSPAVAKVRIRAGGSSGTILCVIALAANGSLDVDFPRGRFAQGGLYYEKVSGTVEGSVFYG